ncbi:MAG: CoA pyrophosphatase [Polyangiaceae bacterium]|nr:CoA pyrophosphatase [Polyangiaceae bacterium]
MRAIDPEHVRASLQASPPRASPFAVGRPSAVLAALFDQGGEPRVWLVRKSAHLRSHGGQVALPGGKPEGADATLLDTALREAHEEIGLPPRAVEVLGALDPYTTITGYVVTPYVAWVTEGFTPVADEREVARVFHAPLALFATPPAPRPVQLLSFRAPMPSHLVDGETVWGATLAILSQLAEKVG